MTLVPAPTISRTSAKQRVDVVRGQERGRFVKHQEPTCPCGPARAPQPVEGAHDGKLRPLDRGEPRHRDQRVEIDGIAGEQIASPLCLRPPIDGPAVVHGKIVHHEILENGQ